MLYPEADSQTVLIQARVENWVRTAILGLNICPFAHTPVKTKRLRYAVSAAHHANQVLEELKNEALLLAQSEIADLETTLLILPNTLADFVDFNFFLDEADALFRRIDLEGVLQIASFHPAYQFANTDANDIGNYTNRSPYPILHLLREDSVSRAVDSMSDPDLIVANNLATMQRLGHEGWQRLWEKQRESEEPKTA